MLLGVSIKKVKTIIELSVKLPQQIIISVKIYHLCLQKNYNLNKIYHMRLIFKNKMYRACKNY